jgi:hypothetical protein
MAAPNINAGQFSIGPNNSVAIYQGGTEVNWGLITEISWTSSKRNERRQVKLMSGYTFDLVFDNGWQGTIDIQRTNADLDKYWYVLEQSVQGGLPYPSFNIIQTVRETDGTITKMTFQGAIVTYDDAGTFVNEEGVVQKLTFTSPVRVVE